VKFWTKRGNQFIMADDDDDNNANPFTDELGNNSTSILVLSFQGDISYRFL